MLTNRKKLITISFLSILALLIASTFAWTNFNAAITNSWVGRGSGSSNDGSDEPGGTLHNNHTDNSQYKQVFVENWGNEEIYVRIRLDEYMELGDGAGKKSDSLDHNGNPIPNPLNKAVPLLYGTDINDTATWRNNESAFRRYWQMEMGGQAYYLPATRANRTNMSYVSNIGNTVVTENCLNYDGIRARQTPMAQIMTMAQWVEDGNPIGNYWVIDEDGWVYWASPIQPGTATGLLLNGVSAVSPPNEDYYYGIHVDAQMATKDLDELDNFERFGAVEHGGWTAAGEKLMRLITNVDSSGSIAPELSETFRNLYTSIQIEMSVAAAFRSFADVAQEEGFPTIANLFLAAAYAEDRHVEVQWEVLQSMGATVMPEVEELPVRTTAENLELAYHAESDELAVVFMEFLATAIEEGFEDAARVLQWALEAKDSHAVVFRAVIDNLDNPSYLERFAVVYVCRLCGEVVTVRPNRCPICDLPGASYTVFSVSELSVD